MKPHSLPVSAIPWSTVFAGSAGALLSLGVVMALALPPLPAMVIMLSATALPMWWLEWRRARDRTARRAPDGVSLPGVGIRRRLTLLGTACVVMLVAGSFQLQTLFGGLATGGLPEIALVLLPAGLAWCLWSVVRQPSPDGPDALEQLGLVVRTLLRHRRLEPEGRQHLLAWCVKAFFLPLMLAWLYVWLESFRGGMRDGHGWFALFTMGMALLYALDTLFGTIGYLSTSRRIDAHIRSTDATWLGWLAALVCYPPASGVVLRQWLEYKDGVEWFQWLQAPWLMGVWGGTILLLTAIYTSATLVFGPRFSNLTNRGIVTAGPFLWTKHPAYISKNLSWWLIAVPFVSSQGAGAAAVNCLALLGVNGIYWLRARTEERHLMDDSTYRAYAAWIAEHGVFARVRRLLLPRRASAGRG